MKTKTRRNERRASEAGLPKRVAQQHALPFFLAAAGAGRVIPFRRARRLGFLQIALARVERRFLSKPFTSEASLAIDKALLDLEIALDEEETES